MVTFSIPPKSKRCPTCGQTKPASEFAKDTARPDGMSSRCRLCRKRSDDLYRMKPETRQRERAYRASEQGRQVERRKRCRRFGLSVDDYEQMLAEQLGVCAICGAAPEGKRLAIDHDHQTGRVRGLLCTFCNIALGGFRDSPELLGRAISYLANCANPH